MEYKKRNGKKDEGKRRRKEDERLITIRKYSGEERGEERETKKELQNSVIMITTLML